MPAWDAETENLAYEAYEVLRDALGPFAAREPGMTPGVAVARYLDALHQVDTEALETRYDNARLVADDLAGRMVYEAYCRAVGGVSVHGETLPGWDELRRNNPVVTSAWIAVGREKNA